jgi:hypothetical protein
LAWLGHVIRINQAGVAEKVYESKLEWWRQKWNRLTEEGKVLIKPYSYQLLLFRGRVYLSWQILYYKLTPHQMQFANCEFQISAVFHLYPVLLTMLFSFMCHEYMLQKKVSGFHIKRSPFDEDRTAMASRTRFPDFIFVLSDGTLLCTDEC